MPKIMKNGIEYGGGRGKETLLISNGIERSTTFNTGTQVTQNFAYEKGKYDYYKAVCGHKVNGVIDGIFNTTIISDDDVYAAVSRIGDKYIDIMQYAHRYDDNPTSMAQIKSGEKLYMYYYFLIGFVDNTKLRVYIRGVNSSNSSSQTYFGALYGIR